MPVWHDKTLALQDNREIQMVGLIQEQHPDRCRLFMQWKGMTWPVMVDSLNELEVAVVPITLLIDEYGIIRKKNPRRISEFFDDFVTNDYMAPDEPDESKPEGRVMREGGDINWTKYGNAVLKWKGDEYVTNGVEGLKRAVEVDPSDGLAHFQLGVAYRMRYDSPARQPGDFQNAINQWSKALALNPNQYIWRRRIQQYGARLMKPYSFYDWVIEARQDLQAAGHEPTPIAVEPSGAEFAQRERQFTSADTTVTAPDPDGRIHTDDKPFIISETTVVPATAAPGTAVRFHVVLEPNAKVKAHWNNEAQPLQVWIDPPAGWKVDRHHHTVANATTAVSLETRRIEFELRIPPDAAAGRVTIPVYALYNVCEGEEGTCLYRRLDLPIDIHIAATGQ